MRILTYNVLYGGLGRERLIRDLLQSIAADVGVFTEVTSVAALMTFADVIGPYVAVSGRSLQGMRTAIVSRTPLIECRSYGPPWSTRRWVEAMIRPARGPALCIHAIQLTAHAVWPLELWRVAELAFLLRQLRGLPDRAHIVAGDFNAIMPGEPLRSSALPWRVRAQLWLNGGRVPSYAMPMLTRAGYVDCYRAGNDQSDGFTVPAWNPVARIDYVFASPALRDRLRASGVPKVEVTANPRPTPRRSPLKLLGFTGTGPLGGHGSDHLPVWADFDYH